MDFRFIAPDLRELDLATTELVVCGVWSDVRPMQGTAGLLDFRLAGKLSRLCREAFIEGALGEVVLVPGKPKLPFDKLLLVGLGPRLAFTDAVYTERVKHIARALEELKVARAVVELPGRGDGAMDAERAAELLVPAITRAPDDTAELHEGGDAHDAWWLVEGAEAQRLMGARFQQDRRILRRR